MKKSNQAKTSEGKDGVDYISNLPDHILRLIISRLQGTEEEVMRTSILSTRWRYLWASVPFIDIDCQGLVKPKSKGLKEFVDWVLLNKPFDLDSFRLCCENFFIMFIINKYIHAAVTRKVKLLDLRFCPKYEFEDIKLPHCLVSCGSLEVLKLCLYGWCLFVPNITGFQSLRVLELTEVELFDENLLKYFLENCPSLEDLSLIDCRSIDLIISSPKLKNLRINTRKLVSDEEEAADEEGINWRMCSSLEFSCPKLEVLKLSGFVAMEFLFENLDSLKEVVIHAEELFRWKSPSYDLFARISHVESLSTSSYCIGQLYYLEVDEPLSLPNLKTLELTVDGIYGMDTIIPFLKCLPDLESLHLIFPKHIYLLQEWKPRLDEVESISILTRHLKKAEFRVFNEEKSKLGVARTLLEHGNALEEMLFSWTSEARFNERSMEIINEVSKYHKASSTVKIRCVINPSQADPRPARNIIEISSNRFTPSQSS